MTKLMRKNVKFVWNNKCEEAFQSLKHLLTHVLVLVVLEGNQDLVVYIDVCGTGLGAVLMQTGKMIAYASR